jgi:hypothetical protein
MMKATSQSSGRSSRAFANINVCKIGLKVAARAVVGAAEPSQIMLENQCQFEK